MFDEKKFLITGGSGLLGSTLRKIFPEALYPSEDEFNVLRYDEMDNYIEDRGISTIFHGAAFTSPPKIDKDPMLAIDINIIGTSNMVKLAEKYDCRLIYICTDYVFKGDKGNYKEDDPLFPVNKYAWSKLGGECAVRLYDNSLIIRTTFGPDTFPYEKAFTDQWTSRESVSKIAGMMEVLIRKGVNGTIHVGGARKTVYEYAKSLDQTKEIGKISIKDIAFQVPVDTSLNIEHYKEIINNKNN
jgi:dTDP-4-dehydrorhamnose reductase